jgi:hypothetical protein
VSGLFDQIEEKASELLGLAAEGAGTTAAKAAEAAQTVSNAVDAHGGAVEGVVAEPIASLGDGDS